MSLRGESLRFNELKRHARGVSQKMLTSTLRELERDGFVMRTMYATIPPRYDHRSATPRSGTQSKIGIAAEHIIFDQYPRKPANLVIMHIIAMPMKIMAATGDAKSVMPFGVDTG